MRARVAILAALALAACGVKGAPRPAASSGADPAPAAVPAPGDPASGGTSRR